MRSFSDILIYILSTQFIFVPDSFGAAIQKAQTPIAPSDKWKCERKITGVAAFSKARACEKKRAQSIACGRDERVDCVDGIGRRFTMESRSTVACVRYAQECWDLDLGESFSDSVVIRQSSRSVEMPYWGRKDWACTRWTSGRFALQNFSVCKDVQANLGCFETGGEYCGLTKLGLGHEQNFFRFTGVCVSHAVDCLFAQANYLERLPELDQGSVYELYEFFKKTYDSEGLKTD